MCNKAVVNFLYLCLFGLNFFIIFGYFIGAIPIRPIPTKRSRFYPPVIMDSFLFAGIASYTYNSSSGSAGSRFDFADAKYVVVEFPHFSFLYFDTIRVERWNVLITYILYRVKSPNVYVILCSLCVKKIKKHT